MLEIMDRELTDGVPADRIAFLTFTVAARAEAKERAIAKFEVAPERLKWVRTLHSTAYELLGIQPGTLVTDGDGQMEEFAHRFGYEFSDAGYTSEGIPFFGFETGDKLMAFDHLRRHREMNVADAYALWQDEKITLYEANRFADSYAKWKAEDGRMDFTDLLHKGADVLPCDVVIVDEAQDLSPLQWRCFWRFAAGARRVYIGGDDDQAIYEWAGASPDAFLNQPGSIEVLPQSYRCPRVVTDLARRVIERVKYRQPKEWKARDAAGELRHVGHVDHVDIPAEGSVLALFRNHAMKPAIAEHLTRLGETFTYQNKRSVNPEAARAIIMWERLRKGQEIMQDDIEAILTFASEARISRRQREAARQLLPPVEITQLVETAGWPEGIFEHPWYAILDRLRDVEFYLRKIIQRGGAQALIAEPRIKLSTIHGVKGAEADHVILNTGMSKLVTRSAEKDPDPERRVWYVGLTRARKSLTLIGFDNPLL